MHGTSHYCLESVSSGSILAARQPATSDPSSLIERSTLQVTAVAKQNSDASYTISVDAPSSANYDLLLKRGSDYRTVQVIQNSVDGDYSNEFDMAAEPSTYYIAVESSDIEEIHPLIVKGYDISMTTEDSVERGNSVDVSLSLSQVDPDARSAEVVQVVIGNDSEPVQVNASQTALNYEATVDTDTLSPGTYSVYGVVRGPQELESGDVESLGVSDRQLVTVTSGSSGGGGGSTATATSTSTPTPTTTDTTASPSPPPTDDEVVTPATTSADRGPATETGGQPGFGASVGTVAVLAGDLLLTRRRREN